MEDVRILPSDGSSLFGILEVCHGILLVSLFSLMIHDPSTVAMGNTKDMEKAIEVVNEVKESIYYGEACPSGSGAGHPG